MNKNHSYFTLQDIEIIKKQEYKNGYINGWNDCAITQDAAMVFNYNLLQNDFDQLKREYYELENRLGACMSVNDTCESYLNKLQKDVRELSEEKIRLDGENTRLRVQNTQDEGKIASLIGWLFGTLTVSAIIISGLLVFLL